MRKAAGGGLMGMRGQRVKRFGNGRAEAEGTRRPGTVIRLASEPGCGHEMNQQIGRAQAEGQNHKDEFGIVSGLRRLIPAVEQFDEGTHQTSERYQGRRDSRRELHWARV